MSASSELFLYQRMIELETHKDAEFDYIWEHFVEEQNKQLHINQNNKHNDYGNKRQQT